MNKKKHTLLWRVSDKSLPGDSYVFGTMHVSDERAFKFEEPVKDKIQEVDAFALEFNLEIADLNLTSDAMKLPEGVTLQTLIKPKKFAKINKTFQRFTGYDLELFNHSIPMQITNIMAEVVLSNDRLKSLDETLFHFAKEQNKILLGIETVEEQLAIMKNIPLYHQVKALKDTFKNIKQFRKQVLKMTQLYENADIQQLYKSSKKSTGADRKLLLYDRNEIMATRMIKMMREQTMVCAIGAAHLAGKRGVLRLLKKEGLTVKPA